MPEYKVSVVAEWEIVLEAKTPTKAEEMAMELVEDMNQWSPRPDYFTAKPELVERRHV